MYDNSVNFESKGEIDEGFGREFRKLGTESVDAKL
jgi:hypothetical protein